MNRTLAAQRTSLVESSASHSTGWRNVLTTLPAFAVAILPKCPACLPGFAALASSLGLTILIDTKSVLALTVAFLILAVIGRGMRRNGRRKRVPLALGAFGALIVFTGKLLDLSLMSYGGALYLIASSLWSLSRQRSLDSRACSGCLGVRSAVSDRRS